MKDGPLKSTLFVVLALAWLAACGLGVKALGRLWTHDHEALWQGAVFGVVLGAGTMAMSLARDKGWMKGVFWHKPNDVIRKQQELAADRERIIEEARKKLS